MSERMSPISFVKWADGTVSATEMRGNPPEKGPPDRVQINTDGYFIPGNGRVLNALIAMKPMTQSLPDFLQEMANKQKGK